MHVCVYVCRDRQAGDLVPIEIHILRALKRHPHPNCCNLSKVIAPRKEEMDYG